MTLKRTVFRFAVFGIFLTIGLWMAHSIHDPFQDSKSNEPQFSIETSQSEQYRLLLIVVDKVTNKAELQSAWWISSRVNMPIAMVSLYPNVTQQNFRDTELVDTFSLVGIWNSRRPNKKSLELLNEWDIHWNDYLVIDLAVQAAIVDEFSGITIDGLPQRGKEVNQQVKKLSTSSEQLNYQSKLWSAICSQASKQPEGLKLGILPLNLDNHILTSLDIEKNSIALFPPQPTFPVCMVNAGLMEAALPPFLPTK